jgi:hypothetical protein
MLGWIYQVQNRVQWLRCDHNKEASGFIKQGIFVFLNNYWFLMKVSLS